MVVSGEGSGVVGTSYTLSCRVSLPSGVEPDSLDIKWLGLSTPEPVMISTGVYISTVTLDRLPPTTTDYTCRASYTENGVSSEIVEESLTINVVSKSASFQCQRLWYIMCAILSLQVSLCLWFHQTQEKLVFPSLWLAQSFSLTELETVLSLSSGRDHPLMTNQLLKVSQMRE